MQNSPVLLLGIIDLLMIDVYDLFQRMTLKIRPGKSLSMGSSKQNKKDESSRNKDARSIDNLFFHYIFEELYITVHHPCRSRKPVI